MRGHVCEQRYRTAPRKTFTAADTVPQACLFLRQQLSINQADLSYSAHSSREVVQSQLSFGGAGYAEGLNPGVLC